MNHWPIDQHQPSAHDSIRCDRWSFSVYRKQARLPYESREYAFSVAAATPYNLPPLLTLLQRLETRQRMVTEQNSLQKAPL